MGIGLEASGSQLALVKHLMGLANLPHKGSLTPAGTSIFAANTCRANSFLALILLREAATATKLNWAAVTHSCGKNFHFESPSTGSAVWTIAKRLFRRSMRGTSG